MPLCVDHAKAARDPSISDVIIFAAQRSDEVLCLLFHPPGCHRRRHGEEPRNVQWLGFTDEQSGLLDFVDHLGNNGWARNSQSDAIMTKMLGDVSTLA